MNSENLVKKFDEVLRQNHDEKFYVEKIEDIPKNLSFCPRTDEVLEHVLTHRLYIRQRIYFEGIPRFRKDLMIEAIKVGIMNPFETELRFKDVVGFLNDHEILYYGFSKEFLSIPFMKELKEIKPDFDFSMYNNFIIKQIILHPAQDEVFEEELKFLLSDKRVKKVLREEFGITNRKIIINKIRKKYKNAYNYPSNYFLRTNINFYPEKDVVEILEKIKKRSNWMFNMFKLNGPSLKELIKNSSDEELKEEYADLIRRNCVRLGYFELNVPFYLDSDTVYRAFLDEYIEIDPKYKTIVKVAIPSDFRKEDLREKNVSFTDYYLFHSKEKDFEYTVVRKEMKEYIEKYGSLNTREEIQSQKEGVLDSDLSNITYSYIKNIDLTKLNKEQLEIINKLVKIMK